MKLLSTFCFILFSCLVLAQTHKAPCGTSYDDETLNEVRRLNQNLNETNFRGNAEEYIPMVIHMVGESNGTGYHLLGDILDRVCDLNTQFAPTGFYYYVDEVNYIPNSTYNTGGWDVHGEMFNLHNRSGKVNSYIIRNAGPPLYPICGYSYLSSELVVIDRSCVGSLSTTWAHELGHMFNLPHTFSGLEGSDYGQSNPQGPPNAEKVDGSNCLSAGDGFCDTPPDYLAYRWSCLESGFSGFELLDPDGVPFYVDGSYYMSYSSDDCTSQFSPEQQAAMQHDLLVTKGNMSDGPFPTFAQISGPTNIQYPAMDEEVGPESVTLTWDAMPNADQYHVIVARNSTMTVVVDQEIVNGNSFTINNLPENSLLHWMVKPFNKDHTCIPYTEKHRFRTTESSVNIKTIPSSYLEIFPNPVGLNQNIQLETQFEKGGEAQLNIYHLNGQLMQSSPISIQAGFQQNQFSLEGLGQGVYLLSLETENEIVRKKLVVAE